MIKPPSLVREYTWIWSKDPALDAPPDDAPAEAKADWDRRVDQARDTGQWDGLIKAGQVPTKFTLRNVPGTQWRAALDALSNGRIGAASLDAIAARLAIRGVTNLDEDNGKVEIKFKDFPGIGSIADEKIINLLDGYDMAIVAELAVHVVKRQNAGATSPK